MLLYVPTDLITGGFRNLFSKMHYFQTREDTKAFVTALRRVKLELSLQKRTIISLLFLILKGFLITETVAVFSTYLIADGLPNNFQNIIISKPAKG